MVNYIVSITTKRQLALCFPHKLLLLKISITLLYTEGIYRQLYIDWNFPGGTALKNLPANAGDKKDSDLMLWNRKWQPVPVFLPGKFHGQRRLVGYSQWGHKESDMNEHKHLTLLYY